MTGCAPTGIRTGFPISAARESEKAHWRLVFGPQSLEPVSHVIEAVDSAFLLLGFNLDAADVFEVDMVAGATNTEYSGPIIIDGQKVTLSGGNNLVFLPWPLRYRLRKVAGPTPLGQFMVYAQPVPFEYGWIQR